LAREAWKRNANSYSDWQYSTTLRLKNTMNLRRMQMVDILSKVLNGTLSPAEGLSAWPNIDDPTDDQLMRSAWHSLYHYNSDEDIRGRDPDYNDHLTQGLRKILRQLQNHAP
jgi:hypothetical protein